MAPPMMAISLSCTFAYDAEIVANERPFDAKSMGVEIFIAKGFGPITPYAAVGRMRADTTAQRISNFPTAVAVPPIVHESDFNRYTAGVRISLMVPKIAVEVTQAEERSYAAKISFGLF